MSRLLETHARVTRQGADARAAHQAGDVVRFEIHAVLEGDASPRWPTEEELQQALGQGAAVLDGGVAIKADDSLGVGGAHARAWNVQILLPPGEGSLGPVPLGVVGPDGAELERGDVPAVALNVGTVLEPSVAKDLETKQEAAELKAEMTRHMAAPRGPWDLRPQWPLGWMALLFALLCLIGWAAWKVAKRPRRVPPPPPPELPEVIARRRLAALGADHGLDRAGHFAFHVELADILRDYLSGRLGTDVTELTTDEVRRMLRGEMRSQAALALGSTPHAGEARVEIVRVLSACDLVKFARHVPAPVEALELLRDVARIVDMTTVQGTPVGAVSPGAIASSPQVAP